MNWYYADESDQQHEISEHDLPSLVDSGTISQTTLLWNETMADWKPASEARPDLFAELDPNPPALTPYQAQAAASPVTAALHQPVPTTDPLAVIALVFGVLGIICFPFLGLGGVICGHIAYNKAVRSGEKSANKGLALGGLITGYIGVLIVIVIIAIYGFAFFMAFQEGGFESEFDIEVEGSGDALDPSEEAPE